MVHIFTPVVPMREMYRKANHTAYQNLIRAKIGGTADFIYNSLDLFHHVDLNIARVETF